MPVRAHRSCMGDEPCSLKTQLAPIFDPPRRSHVTGADLLPMVRPPGWLQRPMARCARLWTRRIGMSMVAAWIRPFERVHRRKRGRADRRGAMDDAIPYLS